MSTTLALPMVSVKACNCRLILDSAMWSRSIRPNAPIPERASASAHHDPTPPMPATTTDALARRCGLPGPYKRSRPPKRRWESEDETSDMAGSGIDGNDSHGRRKRDACGQEGSLQIGRANV